jgi:hypothetical protein
MSGGELLELQLLDTQLVDTFCRKTTAQHKFENCLNQVKPGLAGFEQL